MKENQIEPINSVDYLEKLLSKGYTIKGPRKDFSKDLAAFKAFLTKRKEFVTEAWLTSNGYKFVEPSTFTKGHRIAYKIIDDFPCTRSGAGFPDERFNSNYSLALEDKEMVLFLKSETPKEG
jgi:hypothetical protein